MDIYKTPESELDIKTGGKFKPIKAIVFGLLVSVVLVMFVSIIEYYAASVLLGINLTDEEKLNTILSNNTAYLASDLIITSVILFYAGRVVRKYAPNKEIMFAAILTLLTSAIYIPLAISSDSFSTYPVWYNALNIIILFWAIIVGAKPKNKT